MGCAASILIVYCISDDSHAAGASCPTCPNFDKILEKVHLCPWPCSHACNARSTFSGRPSISSRLMTLSLYARRVMAFIHVMACRRRPAHLGGRAATAARATGTAAQNAYMPDELLSAGPAQEPPSTPQPPASGGIHKLPWLPGRLRLITSASGHLLWC